MRGPAALADLSGDGTLDLLAGTDHDADPYTDMPGLCSLRGRPAGPEGPSFELAASYAPQVNLVLEPDIADFNGDGRLDVVHGEWTPWGQHPPPPVPPYFILRMGNGDGTLGDPRRIEAPAPSPMWIDTWGPAVHAGDFNRDGRPDVLLTSGPWIVVFLGDGNGGFQPGWSVFESGVLEENDDGEPVVVRAAFLAHRLHDLDGDGREDVVSLASRYDVRTGTTEYSIEVWRGRGDGSFDDPATLVGKEAFTGVEPRDPLLIADFDGDGLPDIALPLGGFKRQVSLLLNEGSAIFADPIVIYEILETQESRAVYDLGAADVNADQIMDVTIYEGVSGCTGDSCFNRFNVIYGLGGGAFSAPETITSRFMNGALVQDLSGDGLPDFLIYGGGWLSPGIEVIVQGAPAAVGLFHRGDANDDGRADISDALHTLNFLYLGGPAPPCREAANANDDRTLDITDAIYLLQGLFLGGPLPAPPGPPPAPCGRDPAVSPSALGCGSYIHCQ